MRLNYGLAGAFLVMQGAVFAADEEKKDNFLIVNGADKIKLTNGITMVAQRSSGLEDKQAAMAYSADLALEGQMGNYGYVFVSLKTAQGQSLNSGLTGGTNRDDETAQFADTSIAEARYDVCFSDMAYLTLGKIDSAALYDSNEVANNETTQFLAGMFVHNITIPFAAYSAGANLTFEPKKNIKLQAGVFEPTVDFVGDLTDTLFLAEAAYNTKLAQHDSNWRLTVWDCNACTVGVGQIKNHGQAVNMDFALNEAVRIFVRYGHLNDPMAGFDQSFSFGGQMELNDKHRIGAAYGISSASENGAANESVSELYFSFAWQPNVTFTADVQFVNNPGFDSQANDFSVFGLRSQVDF